MVASINAWEPGWERYSVRCCELSMLRGSPSEIEACGSTSGRSSCWMGLQRRHEAKPFVERRGRW
jgi:hypothetical protein